MASKTALIGILCLVLAGCSNVNAHGLDTHNVTVPVYHQQF
jgi:hypothetical protein